MDATPPASLSESDLLEPLPFAETEPMSAFHRKLAHWIAGETLDLTPVSFPIRLAMTRCCSDSQSYFP
jgi:hypothetical protein